MYTNIMKEEKKEKKSPKTKSVTVRILFENYNKMLKLTPTPFANITEILNFSAYVVPAWINGNLFEKNTITNMLVQLRKERYL